ncbi:2,3-bisphosphoglycerate-dependent phosphoglycerate mutase [Candidatus Gottesmanbacteria bacterium]|nr:2,3-bisphosphoglycerate-dependent phosphoglycerate mutase [Candidatus Gottesmanbacteria bacterium]
MRNDLSTNGSRLVCIRHGESLWNAKSLWTGWTDIGLSEKGKKEAETACNNLSHIHFDIAFTSTLVRAKETLEIMKRKLRIETLPTIEDASYNERNYGIYTGKNKWDIESKVGKEEFIRIRRGWDVPIPQGESLKDVYNRVVPAFKKNILPYIQKGSNILFVTHGNTIRALMKFLENIPDEKISSVEIATGEVIVYTFSKEGKIVSKDTLQITPLPT